MLLVHFRVNLMRQNNITFLFIKQDVQYVWFLYIFDMNVVTPRPAETEQTLLKCHVFFHQLLSTHSPEVLGEINPATAGFS